RTVPVIIDAVDGNTATGRTKGDAPEIDGIVTVRGITKERPGDIIPVNIVKTSEYDLQGDVAQELVEV
ncbi:MAG: 30S ribosomal protein S12 methylthiotransferase RimO, partial [Alphaproteobacteria bacterium]|nr:30S ribosomal protein S12 methylthiotransferase RimO [Alphaproteobacteria bacterium]